MVQLLNQGQKTNSGQLVSGPVPRPEQVKAASGNINNSADQEDIRRISQGNFKAKAEETQPNIFVRLWAWIKSLFAKKPSKTKPKDQEISGPKIEISERDLSVQPFADVEVYDGLITIDNMAELTQKYIVVFADNAERHGGLFGQTSVLRPSQKLYPESVVGIPVSAKPVTSYDINEVKAMAYTENTADEVRANLKLISDSIDDAIQRAKQQGKKVLLLRGGYGTGFSRMPVLNPLTFKGMVELFQNKLGVSYQIDSITGRYSLRKSTEVLEQDLEQDQVSRINLLDDPWIVMNHGRSGVT